MYRSVVLSTSAFACLCFAAFLFVDRVPNRAVPGALSEGRQAWEQIRHRSDKDIDWRHSDAQHRRARRMSLSQVGIAATASKVSELPGGLDGVWAELGSSNLAGRVSDVELDPADDSIYAFAHGGQIWQGDLAGSNWRVLNDNISFAGDLYYTLELARVGGKRRLLVNAPDEDGIYYSDDQGASWSRGPAENDPHSISFDMVVPDSEGKVVYRAVRRLNRPRNRHEMWIYHSRDGGASETLVDVVVGERASLYSPPGSPRAFVLIDNQLFESKPQRLLSLHNFGPSVSANAVQVVALSGGVNGESIYLYASFGQADQSIIYRSLDGGVSFENRGPAPTTMMTPNSFSASASDPNLLYVGAVQAYVSSNGGTTWQLVNHWRDYYTWPESKLHADIPVFASVTDSQGEEIVLIGTDGGLYSADVLATSPSNLSTQGLNISQYYSLFSNPDQPSTVFLGSQDQGYQRGFNVTTGSQFEQVFLGDFGSLTSADRGQSLWTVYPQFAMYSPDANAATMPLEIWDFTFSGHLWLPPLAPVSGHPDKIWLGGGGFGQRHYLFQLTYWSCCGFTVDQGGYDFGASIEALAADGDTLYAANRDGAFFFSRDASLTWTRVTLPDSAFFFPSSIAIDPSSPQTVLVGGAGYSGPGVYMSDDAGVSFVTMDQGLPNTFVSELTFSNDGSLLVAATDLGPYQFDWTERQWIFVGGNGAPDQRYTDVEWLEAINAFRFTTYGRGAWQLSLFDPETMWTPDQADRGDRSGNALALAGDIAVSGAWFSRVQGQRSGAAFVHQRDDQGQWQQAAQLLPANPVQAMRFGASVAVSPDQSTILIGAPGEANRDGAAYLFRRQSDDQWSDPIRIPPPEDMAATEFGSAVALSNTQAFIGAQRHKQNNRAGGLVFAFDSATTPLALTQSFAHGDYAHGDRFGASMAFDPLASRLIVGAPYRDHGSKQKAGAAYVFSQQSGQWSEQAKLLASPIRAGDRFGSAVAISGELAAVGAPLRNISRVSNTGAAFVFTANDEQWDEGRELVANDANLADQLGRAVAIANGRVVVGAPFYDEPGTNAGAVLIFAQQQGDWQLALQRQGHDTVSGDRFGIAVAADSRAMLVGAELSDQVAPRAGSIYFMRTDG